jgi:curved DNA-binding protein CbpA
MENDWRDDVLDNITSLSSVNLYEILEVDKEDDASVFKKQYRKLALKYHPDKGGEDSDKFELINLAYHILSDPELRQKYDDIYEGYSDFTKLKDTAFHTVKTATADDHKQFNALAEQLNKKHGFDVDEDWKPEEIFRRKLNLEDERTRFEKELKENTTKLSEDDFTHRFEEGREVDGPMTGDLVAFNESAGAVSNWVSLNDFEQLYDDRGSLEDNFKLPSLGKFVDDDTSLEARMRRYEEEGKHLAGLTKTNKVSLNDK